MTDTTAPAALLVLSAAEHVVDRLIEEMHPSTAAVWEQLARRAYLEGRIAGLEWARAKVSA